MSLNNRLEHEKKHGNYLSGAGAEDVWNWSTPAGKTRALRRAEFFCDVLGSQTKALELGCGTGYFTRLVAVSGADIVAIDLSDELLDEAARKSRPDNVTYAIADAHNLKYEKNTFDTVYGSSVLHHLDFHRALTEIFRVLKPGGRFVFAEPNMLNPQIFCERKIPYLRKKLGVSPDETAYIRFSLARDLRSVGFTEIRIIPHEFLHPAIPERFIPFVTKLTEVLEKLPLIREIGGSLLIKGKKPPE